MKFLLFCAILGFAVAKVDYSGHRVYRAFPTLKGNDIIKDIGEELNLDFWSDYRYEGDFVDFRVPTSLKRTVENLLQRHGIRYETMIDDLGILIKEQTTPREPQMNILDFDYNKYHNYEEIDNWIEQFAASDPLVTDMSMGRSYEGRNMGVVKISSGKAANSFVINCGTHAREWVTPATCMFAANKLVQQYGKDSTITELIDNVDFYIIPSSNPDGYAFTHSNDRMWRKTRSYCTGLCTGVDPNRNWDAAWMNGGNGASSSCCSETYRGLEAFSEIETRNQRDFVQSLTNVKGYIDVHAYGQMWMYPFGYTANDSPDESDLRAIGIASVAAIKAVNGEDYATGSIADVIYVASGNTADYFYLKQNVKCSFAAELRDKGRYGFNLPERLIQATAEETFAGLMEIAKAIKDDKCNM